MPMRDGGTQALATGGPSVGTGHVGRCPGLINENQTIRIQIKLILEPLATPRQDVRTILLRGVAGLFLRVIR